jgi:hypothetical protein
MGFSIITLATAKGVTSAYVSTGRLSKTPGKPALADLVTQDDAMTPDLSKVQMLTWTLIASATYLYSVTQALPHFNGSNFPDINPALMALMGIGQGAYLSGKIIASQSIAIVRVDPPRGMAPGARLTIVGTGFGSSPGTVLFSDVVAAFDSSSASPWSDTSISIIIPPTHTNHVPFVNGETVYIAVLLQGTNSAATSNTIPYTF